MKKIKLKELLACLEFMSNSYNPKQEELSVERLQERDTTYEEGWGDGKNLACGAVKQLLEDANLL